MRTGVRTLRNAKELRRAMSPPELALWMRLKGLSNELPRFRRQHPIGPYVADFYCPSAKLVIEIDGWGHNMGDHPARDEQRDAWLIQQGYAVVRFPATEVLTNADKVVDAIVRQTMATEQPPPSRR